ncbi:hypothetical protein CANCADRAFT_71128 [Tortispora caseinolytica NRRL Y-17796]|uniref:Uncharacterized protein n=1 Tax=Tortispora caseinolytica NRRL Y-17796 TaxID=767744 RepID=A0A1E4TIA7_9ASCO|nr:hypothetical protein CANCADRAFT_71128 [Tortispora caseinolytica NRRL Y-17796]
MAGLVDYSSDESDHETKKPVVNLVKSNNASSLFKDLPQSGIRKKNKRKHRKYLNLPDPSTLLNETAESTTLPRNPNDSNSILKSLFKSSSRPVEQFQSQNNAEDITTVDNAAHVGNTELNAPEHQQSDLRSPVSIPDIHDDDIPSFNVDEVIRQGSMNAAVESTDTTTIQTIGSGKHQLSSLLLSATAQRDAFQKSFEDSRRSRKTAKQKYAM